MTRAELLADLRSSAFGRAHPVPPRRIGAEIEVIPADAVSGLIAPISSDSRPATLPVLRTLASALHWTEKADAGAPKFLTREGCLISYEPGGQIELSTPPVSSVGAVVRLLDAVLEPLRETAAGAGILLREVGADPVTPPDGVGLQLSSDRYLRMDRYLAGIGPAGPRMMRQTASMQVNVDWADDVALHWRVLNAVAPYLTAIFANSPSYGGDDMGARSYRALTWLALDPLRTGIAPRSEDPAAAYLELALGAPAILALGADRAPTPFHVGLDNGSYGPEEWAAHLTTLFPDIRPKGFAEVRCIDALPARWLAAPLVLLVGLAHPVALQRVAETLEPPDPSLPERAARAGLSDARIAERAAAIFRIGLAGAESIGADVVEPRQLGVGWEYFTRFTAVGRCPADEAVSAGGHEVPPVRVR